MNVKVIQDYVAPKPERVRKGDPVNRVGDQFEVAPGRGLQLIGFGYVEEVKGKKASPSKRKPRK